MPKPSSVQRTFRLSARTSRLLDEASELATETRNALADRLLGEALRTERHPLIRFRTGAAGRREPFVVGTRLLVRQIVATVRADGGTPDEVATHLGTTPAVVRAAVAYHSDFAEEVDDDAEWAARVESDERRRWQRQQTSRA